MKFIHIADLHLGKRYCEFSLIEDQKFILDRILDICKDERPDCMLIAGDVYDKSVPSAEAVELLDGFLTALASRGIKVFLISGNHDSAERIAFGSALMAPCGVYASPVYNGDVKPVVLQDEYGKINVYSLPFIRPATVRRFFEDKEINTYTQAVGAAIELMNVNTQERNVLIAHQFVTGSSKSGSEEFLVGDVGNVDADVFSPFDYVALGHIHGAQNVGCERLRYAGTPLKYSLSEQKNVKSVTIAELGEKGSLSVRTVELKPMHDVVEIRGTYEQLTDRNFYAGTTLVNDYVHVVLTDEEEVPDAQAKLNLIYKYVLGCTYDNTRTRTMGNIEIDADAENKSPIEMFSALYEMQNNQPMSEEQEKLVKQLIDEIWGEGL